MDNCVVKLFYIETMVLNINALGDDQTPNMIRISSVPFVDVGSCGGIAHTVCFWVLIEA